MSEFSLLIVLSCYNQMMSMFKFFFVFLSLFSLLVFSTRPQLLKLTPPISELSENESKASLEKVNLEGPQFDWDFLAVPSFSLLLKETFFTLSLLFFSSALCLKKDLLLPPVNAPPFQARSIF